MMVAGMLANQYTAFQCQQLPLLHCFTKGQGEVRRNFKELPLLAVCLAAQLAVFVRKRPISKYTYSANQLAVLIDLNTGEW